MQRFGFSGTPKLMTLSEYQAFMILNALPNIGPYSAKRLLSHFRGDVRRIFSTSADQIREIFRIDNSAVESILNHQRLFDLRKEEDRLAILRAEFIHIEHRQYPSLLKEIPDAPVGIYAIGNVEDSISSKNIAVVGSRSNTLYGLEVARKLAMELAGRGFCIVSGMARGIDAAAHEGALAVKGKTIAVLGCGVDVIYPRENSNLYKRISEHGMIISEFRLGRHADKQTFPIRNRLIAGLCHAVIVVESDKMGGSMITARFANEYGRHVFAVPGRIDQPSSAGCLDLIRNGATMLTCVEDIFDDLPYLNDVPKQSVLFSDFSEKSSNVPEEIQISCPVEKKIYKILSTEKVLPVDSIILQSELPVNKVMYSLQMLEIRGLISKRYDGKFEVIK